MLLMPQSEMIEKLNLELEVYTGLRDLSRRQMTIVEGGADINELLRIVGLKQALIDETDKLERIVGPIKREWTEISERLSSDARESIKGLLRRIQEVLREVVELENRARAILECRKEETGREINRVGKGARANKAYGSRTPAMRSKVVDDRG